ncbi:MAG: non-homologous end-joining DNA ligase [Halioglobus sp.]
MTETFGPYALELKNLDKVLYPDSGITKGDVIDYYRRIADLMVPWLKGRVLTMQRFPDGIHAEGFFQKNMPAYFPDWFTRRTVEVSDGKQQVPVCNNLASLVYVANQGSITQHVWLSRLDRIHHPDQMIFDLDPPGDDFEPVRRGARDCLELLEELSLAAGIKTTGSRGLHVVTPLRRQHDFDAVRAFARDCARLLVARYPDRYTIEQRIDRREGKLYLDVQRNAYGQTAVAPFSLRAADGAPVATPIPRRTLDDPGLNSRSYRLDNIHRFLGQIGDPWNGLRRHASGLAPARRKLDSLLALASV